MPASDRFIGEILSTDSKVPILSLLEVNIDGVFERFVDNTEAIFSTASGTNQRYSEGMFKISLPADTAEGTPTATLDFDAGDITIVRKLRQAESRLKFRLWLVLADDPNEVEFGPFEYESTDFTVSATAVSLSLEAEPILDIQIPSLRYTPTVFPGLWDNLRD